MQIYKHIQVYLCIFKIPKMELSVYLKLKFDVLICKASYFGGYFSIFQFGV